MAIIQTDTFSVDIPDRVLLRDGVGRRRMPRRADRRWRAGVATRLGSVLRPLAGYDEDTRHPVAFAERLPLETLDWTQYGFTSFDERFSAPGEVPRHLHLHKSDLARRDFSNVHCGLESS
jgi:hypothetical protein